MPCLALRVPPHALWRQLYKQLTPRASSHLLSSTGQKSSSPKPHFCSLQDLPSPPPLQSQMLFLASNEFRLIQSLLVTVAPGSHPFWHLHPIYWRLQTHLYNFGIEKITLKPWERSTLFLPHFASFYHLFVYSCEDSSSGDNFPALKQF